MLKWSSHNGFVYAMQCNAMQGLKTWSRGHSSVNCRMSSGHCPVHCLKSYFFRLVVSIYITKKMFPYFIAKSKMQNAKNLEFKNCTLFIWGYDGFES